MRLLKVCLAGNDVESAARQCEDLGLQPLGFTWKASGFWGGLGFGVWGLGFRVWGLGFRVPSFLSGGDLLKRG